ncbi:2Fe-2S iron-sulfur cluster-binding protein [Ammoniphilus sp. 3BR4]|uniref:PDR/VanB family oxidoreductase n=1 Tax=Ammoniphilus sp. 3BR4 TaxID=3158265 RepID=UPI003465C693
MGYRLSVIAKKAELVCPGVKRFTLAAADGHRLPGFSGGSHITVYLPTDKGILERQYSLISSPLQDEVYQIAVRLSDSSHGGSAYLHKQVEEGTSLEISWPKNHFPLSFRAKHHVFYAAGIGITPFLAMMAELKARGQSFELHYGSRSKAECPFYDSIRSLYEAQTTFYFSREPDGKKLSVTSLLDHRIGTHVYFCGPDGMIREFTDAAKDFGYPPSSIHWERFAPPRPKTSHAFQVELARSGKVLDVPADRPILDVLLHAGVRLPYSCKVGGCGTCETKIVEGEADHQDSFLSEELKRGNSVMLPCVSRAKGEKIVLDL